MFNALKYTENLKKSGFSQEQSDKILNVLIEVMDQNLASKTDLKEATKTLRQEMKDIEASLRQEMKDIEASLRQEIAELRQEIKELRTEFHHEMKALEMRMTIKLGSMMAASIVLTGILVKLL